MACGCGKAKMARPGQVSTVTPVPSAQTRQSPGATVIAASTPYKQQNVAPAHLQSSLTRRTV
jgi:hypothetical protein